MANFYFSVGPEVNEVGFNVETENDIYSYVVKIVTNELRKERFALLFNDEHELVSCEWICNRSIEGELLDDSEVELDSDDENKIKVRVSISDISTVINVRY